jgi:GH15 family glucan-1,4-alpha-glucosidase
MIHRPSGAIVAAPTTSLPEKPGGEMNWDYRFAWIRDSTFMLSVMLEAGYRQSAIEWRNWLLRALAGDPDKMRIMYRVDGSRRLEEWMAEWLSGFRWASPVRVGNAASTQRQLDTFGELVNTLHLASQSGIAVTAEELDVVQAIVHHVAIAWRLPDQGLWESRGKPRHYVYSKVSAWVAVDRYMAFEMPSADAEHETYSRIKKLARQMHDEICREGYDQRLGRFVEYYGGQELERELAAASTHGIPAGGRRAHRTDYCCDRKRIDGRWFGPSLEAARRRSLFLRAPAGSQIANDCRVGAMPPGGALSACSR